MVAFPESGVVAAFRRLLRKVENYRSLNRSDHWEKLFLNLCFASSKCCTGRNILIDRGPYIANAGAMGWSWSLNPTEEVTARSVFLPGYARFGARLTLGIAKDRQDWSIARLTCNTAGHSARATDFHVHIRNWKLQGRRITCFFGGLQSILTGGLQNKWQFAFTRPFEEDFGRMVAQSLVHGPAAPGPQMPCSKNFQRLGVVSRCSLCVTGWILIESYQCLENRLGSYFLI